MLQQVSIFTANRQGALSRMTSILAKENINIYTMLANDSAEFGIVRLIVDKPEEAVLILEKEGYQCRVDLVIAIDMGSDKPGALDRILGDLQAQRHDPLPLHFLRPCDQLPDRRLQHHRVRDRSLSQRQRLQAGGRILIDWGLDVRH